MNNLDKYVFCEIVKYLDEICILKLRTINKFANNNLFFIKNNS